MVFKSVAPIVDPEGLNDVIMRDFLEPRKPYIFRAHEKITIRHPKDGGYLGFRWGLGS